MKIKVSVTAIRAALTHAADKDIRHYLNGVYIDSRAGRIVATDGHRLFVADVAEPVDMDSFILGNADAERIVKACGTGKSRVSNSVVFSLSKTDGKVWISAELQDGSKFTFPAIDGRFPDYRRVIPVAVPETLPTAVNPIFIADAGKAFDLLRDRKPGKNGIAMNGGGNNSIIVTDGMPGALVIVMPMRADGNTAAGMLAWFHNAKPIAQSAAA